MCKVAALSLSGLSYLALLCGDCGLSAPPHSAQTLCSLAVSRVYGEYAFVGV